MTASTSHLDSITLSGVARQEPFDHGRAGQHPDSIPVR
jgi:hypothetical protein